jgi:hypothetical protein
MKISDRLADFVVIGSFFWVMMIFSIWLNGYGNTLITSSLKIITALPDKAITPVAGFIAAALIIVLLVTGIFLDFLAGSYFRAIEASIFSKHAKINAPWAEAFTERYAAYIQDDWQNVIEAPLGFGVDAWKRGLNGLKIWNKTALKTWYADVRSVMRARKSFLRLHTFLLSWISLFAGADKIEVLHDQMSLWSVSRALE